MRWVTRSRADILIVGANSRLGKETATLLRANHAAFATSSKNENAADRHLDLTRPESFRRALDGISTVFASAHGLTARAAGSIKKIDCDGMQALIGAAAAGGVKKFVYVSAYGARADHPSPLFRAKADVESRLAVAGLDFVILRPTAFMDLHAHELIGKAVLAGRTAYILGNGKQKRNFVAVEDVAEVAARALLSPDLHGKSIDIGGRDNMTDREVADLYARLSGKRPRIAALREPFLSALAFVIAPFHAGIANLLKLPAQICEEDHAADAVALEALLGRPSVTLEFFARRSIAATQ